MKYDSVAVLDYESGNLLSVCKAVERLGFNPTLFDVTNDHPSKLSDFETIILPGVGAFGAAMTTLQSSGFVEPLQLAARTGQRIVGICLGMQLLFDSSTEFGEHTGLSLIPGTVKHLSNFQENIRVPNIGWCKLRFGCSDNDPVHSIASYGYFVHSYYAADVVEQHVLATADYMGYSVPAIVGNNNVIGFQFHPEKSGPSGLDLLKRYIG